MGDILLVDDNEDILQVLSEFLAERGHVVTTAETADDCLKAVNYSEPDIVILDIWLEDPKKDGLWTLDRLKATHPKLPVVICSAHGNIELAVRTMRIGAVDFVEKPFNPEFMLMVIERTLELAKLRKHNRVLRMLGAPPPIYLAGSSKCSNEMVVELADAADKKSRVMLFGMPGSGKEHAARFMHTNSSRATNPFVVARFTSINQEEAERALFGHQDKKGGVVPGYLEQAHEGTIYFDEVADIPLGTQRTLLRAINNEQFKRVGGTDFVRVDFRVVSGTAQDVERKIAEGKFSRSLFERLNVVTITVPPLDARTEDIEELANHFIEVFHQERGLPRRSLHPDAVIFLEESRWPGNVRQLQNLVEKVLLLGPASGPIKAEEFTASSSDEFYVSSNRIPSSLIALSLREAREEFERQYLTAKIGRFGGNISSAARAIGMERSALHRKLKGLKVDTKHWER